MATALVAKDDDADAGQHDEYSIQFFGFSAKTLADSMYNMMVDSLEASVSELNDNLDAAAANSSSVPTDISDPTSTRRSCDRFCAHARKYVDVICDKMELYFKRNVVVVPKHVTLPEDHVHLLHTEAHRPSVASVLDGELGKLEAEIKAVATKIAVQKEDRSRLDSAAAFCESRLATVDQIAEAVRLEDLETRVLEEATAMRNFVGRTSSSS